jgi:hypothetical protein
MTSAQIFAVLRKYEKWLREFHAAPGVSNKDLEYLSDMTTRFPDPVREREKAMRWLCFMQGVFYSNKVFTVDELREHNAAPATKKDVVLTYQGHSLHRHITCAPCGDLDGCHHWREHDAAPE